MINAILLQESPTKKAWRQKEGRKDISVVSSARRFSKQTLQRALGNQRVGNSLRLSAVQPKLKVGV